MPGGLIVAAACPRPSNARLPWSPGYRPLERPPRAQSGSILIVNNSGGCP
jgi:hypothetical protein